MYDNAVVMFTTFRIILLFFFFGFFANAIMNVTKTHFQNYGNEPIQQLYLKNTKPPYGVCVKILLPPNQSANKNRHVNN